MSNRKPQPLFGGEARAICPVCGKTSYSAAGIHPQCASRREDDKRMVGVRARIAEGQESLLKKSDNISPWKRVCPVCNESQQVRRKSCICGHVFDIAPRPPTEDASKK